MIHMINLHSVLDLPTSPYVLMLLPVYISVLIQKVILLFSLLIQDTLKRVVRAGDGTILATSPSYTRFLKSGVDYAIISPGTLL